MPNTSSFQPSFQPSITKLQPQSPLKPSQPVSTSKPQLSQPSVVTPIAKTSPSTLPPLEQQERQLIAALETQTPEQMQESTPPIKPTKLASALTKLKSESAMVTPVGHLGVGQEALEKAAILTGSEQKAQLSLALEMGVKLESTGRVDDARELLKGVKAILAEAPDSTLSHQAITLSRKIETHGALLGGNPVTMLENEFKKVAQASGDQPAKAIDAAFNIAHEANSVYNAYDKPPKPDNWASQQFSAAAVMYDAGELIRNIANDAIMKGNTQLFFYAQRALQKMPSDSGKPEQLKNQTMLAEMLEINTRPKGKGFPLSDQRVTYPFATSGFQKIPPKEAMQIARATLVIQEAVSQAHQELLAGDLAHFQGSGALGSWRRHASEDPPKPIKTTEVGQLIEHRTMNILKTKMAEGKLEGLSIDAQVKVSGSTYNKAQPDIVLTTDSGHTAYIDITSCSKSSMGHVLKKGGGVLTKGGFLAETTYPPVPPQSITYNPNRPPNRKLTPQQMQEIEAANKEIVQLKSSLDTLKKDIRNMLNHKFESPDKAIGALVDDDYWNVPTAWGLDENSEITGKQHEQNSLQMLSNLQTLTNKPSITGQKAPSGASATEEAVTNLYNAIQYWHDVDYKAELNEESTPKEIQTADKMTKKQAAIQPLLTKLEAYLDTLDRIDTLYAQM
jgi:hypothetical protein